MPIRCANTPQGDGDARFFYCHRGWLSLVATRIPVTAIPVKQICFVSQELRGVPRHRNRKALSDRRSRRRMRSSGIRTGGRWSGRFLVGFVDGHRATGKHCHSIVMISPPVDIGNEKSAAVQRGSC